LYRITTTFLSRPSSINSAVTFAPEIVGVPTLVLDPTCVNNTSSKENSFPGVKLPGLVELSKKVLRLPSNLGYPINVISVTDKVNDLGFATAVGLVKWGSSMLAGREYKKSGTAAVFKGTGKVFDQVKKIFKTLIP
jgi:cell division ATPase FtsA